MCVTCVVGCAVVGDEAGLPPLRARRPQLITRAPVPYSMLQLQQLTAAPEHVVVVELVCTRAHQGRVPSHRWRIGILMRNQRSITCYCLLHA